MPDRIARVWNGSAWEVVTSTVAAPNAIVYYQPTAPSSPVTGQIWVDQDDRQFYIWNGTSWISAITTFNYQSTAPSSPTTGQVWVDSDDRQFYVWSGSAWISAITTSTYQATAPTSPVTGQMWIDSDDNKQYIWSGSAWILVSSAGAVGGGNDAVFFENGNTVTTNYTISSGKNAVSAGPITINNGVVVTIPNGSAWSIV